MFYTPAPTLCQTRGQDLCVFLPKPSTWGRCGMFLSMFGVSFVCFFVFLRRVSMWFRLGMNLLCSPGRSGTSCSPPGASACPVLGGQAFHSAGRQEAVRPLVYLGTPRATPDPRMVHTVSRGVPEHSCHPSRAFLWGDGSARAWGGTGPPGNFATWHASAAWCHREGARPPCLPLPPACRWALLATPPDSAPTRG